jgi:hypothetical protein
MDPEPHRPRTSPILLVVIALALAVGAAASLIAGAATSKAFQPGLVSPFIVSSTELAAVFVLACIVLIGLIVWVRSDSTRLALPGRSVATMLALVLVAIVFVALFHVLGGGPVVFHSTSPAGTSSNNSTSANLTQQPPVTSNVSTPLPVPSPNLPLPPWVLFAAVAAVALAIGAVPALWRRSRDGTGHPAGVGSKATRVAEARGALASAALALDAGTEPRDVIIRLYATLLHRVAPIVGGVDDETPEEIRALHLERLGIRPSAATTLTRLFEEARYSSHPLGPEAVTRAVNAIREARRDLDRTPPAP